MYGQFAYVYDQLMREMPYPRWLRFLRDCFQRYGQPERIVDLGCGTGTIALALAEYGMQVTGIDLSDDMLAVAAHHASDKSLVAIPQWVQQDMREWTLPEPVDCVYSFCDCLNYVLEEDGIRSTFRQTYAGLREGGLFVFDVHAPAQLLTYAQEQPFIYDEDEVAYIWTCDYDPDRLQVQHDLTFFVRDEQQANRYVRFQEQHRQRAYQLDWLSDELRAAGFVVVDRCADFTWSAPDDDSERIFFVAKKLA